MATRRAIRAALRNFLGTYTSRNTDYEGYWLFGFLDGGLIELEVDLLQRSGEPDSPTGHAVRAATAKFEDQLRKAGVARAHVAKAWLAIRKRPGRVQGSINGHPRLGHDVCFLAGAGMDSGLRFECEEVVFVAPHDAGLERRSGRAL
jgi:hypothetical protein